VSRIFHASLLACGGEWLTREATRDDVHDASKVLPWEVVQVCEHSRCIQSALFHLRNQVRDCEGFDLHTSDCSASFDHCSESKVDATDA
jgi:hypothetical protein